MQTALAYTLDDYLATEEESEVRREYWDGEITAMSGVSLQHDRVVMRLVAQLLARPCACEVFSSDVRVRVNPQRYVYADLIVVCGEPRVTDEKPPSLLNPSVLVEVLSESTANRDRGDKLEAYMGVPSLQEYWILEQDTPRAILYSRTAEGWGVLVAGGEEAVLTSSALGIDLPLRALYGVHKD